MSHPVETALERFNQLNAQDPTLLEVDGEMRPRELVGAERLEAWVYRVVPEPSTALRLAARCQHLQRFAMPRTDYPEGRVGYLKWRKDLSKRHADLAALTLREVGLDEDTVTQVRAIVLKQDLKSNPDAQAMEDALCLSFLEHEYATFATKHPDEKVIDIVDKTWCKMSKRGRTLALSLAFSGRALALLESAIAQANAQER